MNYKAKCAIGKRGIGNKRKEGDLITPKGKYKIKYILYRKDRIRKIQSKIKKIAIKRNMGWCNDIKSTKYNKLIKLPSSYSHEKLYKKDNIYDLILVLNLRKKVFLILGYKLFEVDKNLILLFLIISLALGGLKFDIIE